jgi:hypothetical protein
VDWDSIRKIPRFTPLSTVFECYGQPKFRLGNGYSYYMGQGFIISYSDKQFKVKDSTRIEYGEPGEYALSVKYYMYCNELELAYKLERGSYRFEGDILGNTFEIIEGISLGDSLEEVRSLLRMKSNSVYYTEGESQRFIKESGNFEFEHNWVEYGNYKFFFYGKSKKTCMSGFEYIFQD